MPTWWIYCHVSSGCCVVDVQRAYSRNTGVLHVVWRTYPNFKQLPTYALAVHSAIWTPLMVFTTEMVYESCMFSRQVPRSRDKRRSKQPDQGDSSVEVWAWPGRLFAYLKNIFRSNIHKRNAFCSLWLHYHITDEWALIKCYLNSRKFWLLALRIFKYILWW